MVIAIMLSNAMMMMAAAGCTAFLPWAAFVKCHRGAKFTFTNDSTPAPVHYITSHYITLQMLNHQTLTIRLNPLSISDLSLVAPNIQGCTCKPTFQCLFLHWSIIQSAIYTIIQSAMPRTLLHPIYNQQRIWAE